MSDLPVVVNLTAYRGDSWEQQFRFSRAGQPVNLTGAVISADARSTRGEAVVALTVTVDDAANGTLTLTLPAGIDAGAYQYDIEVLETDSTVTTFVRGGLSVVRDVTNELAHA